MVRYLEELFFTKEGGGGVKSIFNSDLNKGLFILAANNRERVKERDIRYAACQ